MRGPSHKPVGGGPEPQASYIDAPTRNGFDWFNSPDLPADTGPVRAHEQRGLRASASWFTATFTAAFDGTCTRMTLHNRADGCTEGCGYLNGAVTVLKKRR